MYTFTSDKIIRDLRGLDNLRQRLRFKDHKVVFTNGCFDLLHLGHIDYLEKARALGDVLIVGINTDASIQRLKGSSRPLQDEEARYRIMAALECVTWVIPFSEDTPQALIARLLPDILVKGDDYQPEQIAGFTEVTENGGSVITIPLVQGYSTTRIVQKIQNNV